MAETICAFCGKAADGLDEHKHCPSCASRLKDAAAASIDDVSMLFAAPGEEDPLVGRVLGGCRLVRKVGGGGMGAVYRAEQLSLGRAVAVKIIHPECATNPRFAARLHSEARAIAVLSHPHILQVYDVGTADGLHYILMEFVEGWSLGDLIFQGLSRETDRCRDILRQTLLGLGHAHERGVIHRDLKPDNILLAGGSFVKLADFGLAKVIDADQHLTATGMVIGTPAYMSPEAAAAGPLDPRSDLYSLGATFYHALAGAPPFSGENPMSILYQHIHEPLPPVRDLNSAVDPVLAEVIETLLAKKPENRYPSSEHALRALNAPRSKSTPTVASPTPTQTVVTPPVGVLAPTATPNGLTAQLRAIATRPSLSPALVMVLLISTGLIAGLWSRESSAPPASSAAGAASSPAAGQPESTPVQANTPPVSRDGSSETLVSPSNVPDPVSESLLAAPSPLENRAEAAPPSDPGTDLPGTQSASPESGASDRAQSISEILGTPVAEESAEPGASTMPGPSLPPVGADSSAATQSPGAPAPEAAALLDAFAAATDPATEADLEKKLDAIAAAAPPDEEARIRQRLVYLRFLKARAQSRALIEAGQGEEASKVLDAFEKANPPATWNEELAMLVAAAQRAAAELELRQRAVAFFELLTQRQWRPLALFFPANKCRFPSRPDERKVSKAIFKVLDLPDGSWIEGFTIEEMRADGQRDQGWTKVSLRVAGEPQPKVVSLAWQKTCTKWRLEADPLYRNRILGIDF